MNYINRLRFDKIKLQYDILKMRDAYIAAEQHILQNSINGFANGMSEDVVEERIIHDQFGNISHQAMTMRDLQIEKLEQRAAELEKAGREFIKREDYLNVKKAKELWQKIMKQIQNLRSK